MKDVELVLQRIKRKAKDKDASFLYGVEYSSMTPPRYQAVLRFSKAISPIVVASQSKKKLIETLESYLYGMEAKDINIKYHQAMIQTLEGEKAFHEGMIKDYKEKGKADEFESTPSEA